jgi:hypothetical protein
MKILAYRDTTGDEPISVYQAIRLRERDPLNYEGRRYYHLIDRRELTAKKRVKNGVDSSSFAFADAPGGDGHGRGGMGIAHALTQIFLRDEANHTGLVRIALFKREFTLEVEEARLEVTFEHAPSGRRLVADVVYTLRDGSEGAEIFGRQLILEVTDQHACSLTKIRLFKEMGIAAIEFTLMSSFHIENDIAMSHDELQSLRRKIHNLCRGRLRVRKLHTLVRV